MFPIKTKIHTGIGNLLQLTGLAEVAKLKEQGKSIGMCTGSFDLMHPGHIAHLNAAKQDCDILVVAIATDEYNRRSRNRTGRPIFDQETRAFLVSHIKAVDYVIITDDNHAVIRNLQPDFYFKGIDYKHHQDEGLQKQAEILHTVGGKMVYTETEKLSTSGIIDYIKEKIE